MLIYGLCFVWNIVVCEKKVNENTLKIPPPLSPKMGERGG
jgi:hypothetical protein